MGFVFFILVFIPVFVVFEYHHQSLAHDGHWDTTDDFVTRFFFPYRVSSCALPSGTCPKSRPVDSLMLSSYHFLCLSRLLPPFTVSCELVLARPDEPEIWPYLCSLSLFMIVRSPCISSLEVCITNFVTSGMEYGEKAFEDWKTMCHTLYLVFKMEGLNNCNHICYSEWSTQIEAQFLDSLFAVVLIPSNI